MERPAVMAFAKATAVQRTILKGGARVSSVHIVLRWRKYTLIYKRAYTNSAAYTELQVRAKNWLNCIRKCFFWEAQSLLCSQETCLCACVCMCAFADKRNVSAIVAWRPHISQTDWLDPGGWPSLQKMGRSGSTSKHRNWAEICLLEQKHLLFIATGWLSVYTCLAHVFCTYTIHRSEENRAAEHCSAIVDRDLLAQQVPATLTNAAVANGHTQEWGGWTNKGLFYRICKHIPVCILKRKGLSLHCSMPAMCVVWRRNLAIHHCSCQHGFHAADAWS